MITAEELEAMVTENAATEGRSKRKGVELAGFDQLVDQLVRLLYFYIVVLCC